jgi:glycerol-3-phosphate dehydrogenase
MSKSLSIRSRNAQLEALGNHIFDVLVLGGGITGVATAHELTRRGYRTALIDSHDFASGTSQESSQLIWGGIKYLERGHIRQVAGLCAARNEWVQQYPDRVARQRFLYPHYGHDPHSLPTILAGAWAYWAIGSGVGWPPLYRSAGSVKRFVPDLAADAVTGGLEYTDARMTTSDARLVLDLLFDAVDTGLTAVNYVEFKTARHTGRHAEFEVEVADGVDPRNFGIRAHWIVNTTGVWVDEVNDRLGVKTPHSLCFSKGIHLVLPRIETREKSLTCVAKDGRIFFVIPWGEATLVGTTDTPHEERPGRVLADRDDIEYLRRECESKFRMKVEDADILNTKAGLRPLVRPKNMKGKDFLELSREHKVWSDPTARISALWGGKYTDAFEMARELADTVARQPTQESGQIPALPPGNLPEPEGYVRGAWTGPPLAEACSQEFVVRLEDLMRRRTNIGLKVAKCGWGHNDEHTTALTTLAQAVGDSTGRAAESVLDEYRAKTSKTAESALD